MVTLICLGYYLLLLTGRLEEGLITPNAFLCKVKSTALVRTETPRDSTTTEPIHNNATDSDFLPEIISQNGHQAFIRAEFQRDPTITEPIRPDSGDSDENSQGQLLAMQDEILSTWLSESEILQNLRIFITN